MKKINGKQIAAQIREEVKAEIKKSGITPGLAVILVGSDPASHLYVGLKEKACNEVGIKNEHFLYFATTPEEEIIAKIKELNAREDIDGILVQLPLPSHMNTDKIISTINPNKDVDGFHPENIKKFLEGKEVIKPVTAQSVIALIKSTGINFKNKKASVICNSDAFAKPIELMLSRRGSIVCHSHLHKDDWKSCISNADIAVVAVGKAKIITANLIKDGAVVIDVGTNKVDDKTIGDVNREGLKEKSGFITPVPGGVGPVTVAMLLKNAYQLAVSRRQ